MNRPTHLAAAALLLALANIGATCAKNAPTCADQLAQCLPAIYTCVHDCAASYGCIIDACNPAPTPTP